MNIWIVNSNTGVTLFYSSLRNLEVQINEHLVSGLLSALNHFIQTQFKQPIESIDMGGFSWIYSYEINRNILCVAADNKDISPAVLRSRLESIKLAFINKYCRENPNFLREEFDGDITRFYPFHKIVDRYYEQWKEAELMSHQAELYDFLRIFQQLFYLLKNAIDRIPNGKRESLNTRIKDQFIKFINNEDNITDQEIKKVSFKKEIGFEILSINVSKCNISAVREQIKNLFQIVIKNLKDDLGYDDSLKIFAKEDILNYIFNNLNLLKKLKIESFLLEIFLKNY